MKLDDGFLSLHIVLKTCTILVMHKFKMSLVFHFYVFGLTSWIWTNPSTKGLKYENLSKWNSYEGCNLDQWLHLCKRRAQLPKCKKKRFVGRKKSIVCASAREFFGHIESVKVLVILNPTGYMLVTCWHLPVLMLSFIWGIFYRKSSTTISEFPEVFNFNWLFLKFNRFIRV